MSTSTESQIEDEDVSTTLYFGNLHPFVQHSSLEDLCAYFGPVDSSKVIKDKGSGSSAGYGFVKFIDRKVAETALQALNGQAYLGQELRVNWALPNNHKEDTSHHFHVFVGDLGSEVTDAVLYNTFCTVGQCSDARVMWDHSTGRSKGYGFVSFRRKEDADASIEQMQGMQIGSRRIRVGWAQHKQDENFSPPDDESIDRADPANTNVYVGNVSPETNEADLMTHFGAYGAVAEVKLHKKGGYGFVKFEAHESAVKAIVQGHNRSLHGRVLKCAWGKSASTSSHTAHTTAPAFNVNLASALQGMQLSSGLMPGNLGGPQQLNAQQNAMISSLAAAMASSQGPSSNMMGMGSQMGMPMHNGLMYPSHPNAAANNNSNNLSMAIAAQMLVLQNMQDSMGLQQAMAAFNNVPSAITAGNLSFDGHGMGGGAFGNGGGYGGRGPTGGLFGGYGGGNHY